MERLTNIRGRKPSTNCKHQRDSIKEKQVCSVCNQEFDKKSIEIEHPTPVAIGGDLNIYSFYCKECHQNKTNFDILFINFLKKVGFLIKVGQFEYEIVDKNKIKEVYLTLKNLKDRLDQ